MTSKKSDTYQLENAADHLKSLHKIGLTIKAFLSASKDSRELASMVVPDVDSFYFNDPITRQSAYDVWGI